MSNFVAVYKNSQGELSIPLVESGGKFFLEAETGQLRPYAATISDAKLGELQHLRTVEVKPEPPMPSDPARDAARAELSAKLERFPTSHLNDFLSRETAFKKAIDAKNDFATAKLPSLVRWSKSIDDEIGRLERERKQLIPPPVFERFHLTRDFRGKYFGDLFIENSQEDGCTGNGWNATWFCRCSKCEASGPPPRTIRAQTILEMEVQYRPMYSCQRPCRG
jgi:hypothetical protein